MNKLSRNSIFGAFLVMSLSAPLAFAQDATTAEQAPPAEQATEAVPTEATATETTATDAAPEATPQKKSWADVDGDKSGALSKTEAATVPALQAVFDQADGDADGSLTADEYKSYVAKVQGDASGDGE